MKIDRELAIRCGLGGNSNDAVCQNGPEWLDSKGFQWPVEFWDVVNGTKRDYAEGKISKAEMDQWLAWGYSLMDKPEVIEYWGNAIYHDEYRVIFEGEIIGEFSSQIEATTLIDERVSKKFTNPYSEANVLKLLYSDAGMVTAPVSSAEEIQSGHTYLVHDPRTGKLVEKDTPESVFEFVDEVVGFLKNQYKLRHTIQQKISDPEDSRFTAWKTISWE